MRLSLAGLWGSEDTYLLPKVESSQGRGDFQDPCSLRFAFRASVREGANLRYCFTKMFHGWVKPCTLGVEAIL